MNLIFLYLNFLIIIKLLLKMMKRGKKLERILVRFYPPGIILELQNEYGEADTKTIDLLNLSRK